MPSVCICTYNRAQSFARTLDTLAAQIGIDWADFEVIVVDNNCTDDTAKVVSAAAGRLPVMCAPPTLQVRSRSGRISLCAGSSLDSIGALHPGLGMNGTRLVRGEETEFFLRAAAAGAKGISPSWRAECCSASKGAWRSLPPMRRQRRGPGRTGFTRMRWTE